VYVTVYILKIFLMSFKDELAAQVAQRRTFAIISHPDAIAKLIPEKLGITLKEAFEQEPKIKEVVESDPKITKMWEFAVKLEGLKRNAGTHAAGLVISNEELWHKTPLFRSNVGTIATQYDGRFLEDVDLIKFDFLGLKTLTVIDNAVKIVKES
jgi:DNA polymerase-3 subunit alpha